MSSAALWWSVTGVLVALELATGTFYLLMLALGAAAGALAAHLHLASNAQLITAAVIGGLAIVGCYLVRRHLARGVPASADRNVNLDIGATLQISHWRADKTATVRYRGAPWTAIYRGSGAPVPGSYRITEIVGSQLVVTLSEAS